MVSKAPVSKEAVETSSVKIEDGTDTAPTPNTIATPKVVSTDNHGNQIEEA